MYRELRPGAALAPYVECFWTRQSDGAPAGSGPGSREHRVLPDGCIDLIFAFHPGAIGGLADAYAVGTMTRAVVVPRDERVAMLGVRFHPGGAAALLGLEAAPLTDLRVALRDAAPSLPAGVEERLDGAGSEARVAALAAALEAMLPDSRPLDRLVAAAVEHVRRAEGRVRVEGLGAALGVTRQHLARAFAREVGVSPKTLARVARLHAVIRRARGEPEPRWGRLAHEMGYADQAHLCGEFRELVGLSPSRWAALE